MNRVLSLRQPRKCSQQKVVKVLIFQEEKKKQMQKAQVSSVRWFISRVTRMHWESPGRHTFGCVCEGVSRKEVEVLRLALNVGSTTPESWGAWTPRE